MFVLEHPVTGACGRGLMIDDVLVVIDLHVRNSLISMSSNSAT